MQTLYALYIQNPFWVWLAVGAVFVALSIASGFDKLVWAGLAAAGLACLNLAGARLGPPLEICLFLAIALGGLAFSFNLHRRRPQARPNRARTEKSASRHAPLASEPASADRSGRLIGRIGRTTGEFSNGVGRVWIDGSEWAAEIDSGASNLPPDLPVRVIGVTGGVRLRVQDLMAQ